MLKRMLLLSRTLLVASVMLLAVTEAGAQVPVPIATPPDITRICEGFSLPGGDAVRIEAGPDLTASSGLADVFPVTESCENVPVGTGEDPFPGTCRRWDYRWIYTGLNPSHSFVSFDTDVTVFGSAPSATVGDILTGVSGLGTDIAGERILRFNANADTFLARFWTTQNIGIGTMTAGFQSGRREGFCNIAGADNPTGDPGLSLLTSIQTATQGCTVEWTLTLDGCVVEAQVITGNCVIETDDLGLATETASCATEITLPAASHTTCRWNSFLRTYTCVRPQH